MTQGYFFIALGKRFILESYLLSNTLRVVGDNKPISILIHQEDLEFAKSFNSFDNFVFFEPKGMIWKQCNTSFERNCLYPRLHLLDYLPYDETIITDTDMLCQYNPQHVWSYMGNKKMPIVMLGRINDPNWHWGKIDKVSKSFGKHVPHVHGGFFYINKNQFNSQFFNFAKEIFFKYDDYSCLRAYGGGRVDEIIFAICHSYFDIMPLEFDEYPVMTFNYDYNIEIPSKLQTENKQNVYLENYIPFIHMFEKMEGVNFKALYSKIIKSLDKNI